MQQVTKLAAHILRPLHAASRMSGHFCFPEAPVIGVGVKPAQHQNCKNRQPFRPRPISRRPGVGGCWLVSHKTTAKSAIRPAVFG